METYTVSFRAMGTDIQAWLTVDHPERAGILQEVPRWFEGWEVRFSRFRPASELSRLNELVKSYAGQWITISPEMNDVIGLALDAAKATDGLFNPLLLPALIAAGYDRSFDQIADKAHVPPAADKPIIADWRAIEHDGLHKRVRLPAGTQFDLGGIVKGWAAQQAVDRLIAFGPCLVNAGGDMAARGSPDGSAGWQVGLPRERGGADLIGTVVLTDSAIATSGIDHRHWIQDGKAKHHLIDPRTGAPAASDVLSATVIASSGVEAEVWAKVTLIAGTCDLAERAGYAALIVHRDLSLRDNVRFEAQCPISPALRSSPLPNARHTT